MDLINLDYLGNPFADIIPPWLGSNFTLSSLYELRPHLLGAAFLILTSSIILKISKNSDNNVENLIRPLISAFVITLVIAASPYWMHLVWSGFVEIAKNFLQWDINKMIVKTIAALSAFTAAMVPENIDSATKMTGKDWTANLFKAGGSVMTSGAMIIQTLLFMLQYVMLQLCHLLAPVAIALYGFDSTRDLANKFILQTLSIMSWIIGFAIVNMVAMKLAVFMLPFLFVGGGVDLLLSEVFKMNVPLGQSIGLYSFVLSSWIVGGSAMVPIFMQALFTSGMVQAGQAFHPSMAGINGINVARGQAGGQGMMPGPGGSMIPTGNMAGNLAGSFTAPLGSRSGTRSQQGTRDAALSNTTGNATVNATANNSSTVNVSSRSSTATPALNASASETGQLSMDNAAAMAKASSGVGGTVGNSPGSTSGAAFDHMHAGAEPEPVAVAG
ncbi:MAG: hypothetical protein K1X66_04750 [Verrucomicrobiae bacterium]|nr:hypothetical protein [Verrucomicrobiae bacterium]